MGDVAGGDRLRSLTSFVGRETTLDRLCSELGRCRLVTLTGPGGVGKTRTAVTAAGLVDFPDGVHVVELASVTEASQVAPAVATALRVPDQSNRDAADRIIDHLRGSSVLLVVDNCEHLLQGSVRLVLRLLDALPDLTVLATSREPLAVRGEQVHRLEPLPVPGETSTPDALDAVPAVRLLLDRVHSVLPEFAITDGNRDAVVALSRKLDGIPLAIELAAVRLRSLSVAQVVERLDGRLYSLSAPANDAEPRQRSLQALIDWSFDLCAADEKLLWARMGVFPAPVELTALEGVCGYGDLAGDRLLDALDGLVGKSVVVVDRDGEVLRYRQFVSLREYGLARLDRDGHTDEIRRRHRDHFTDRARAMIDRWCGPHQADDLARLRHDHPNLIAALAYSAHTPGEAAAGARLAALLRYHWIAGGFLTYGRRWLERLLLRLDTGSAERGEALWVVAWVALIQGDRAAAQEYLEESTTIADALGDVAMRGHAMHWTALSKLFAGDLTDAVRRYRAAIDLHRSAGDVPAELTAAFQLAMAETYAGRPHDGLATSATIVERAEADGEQWNHGYARWVEAIARLHLGELDNARDAILATMHIEREFRDGVCTALSIEVCSWITVVMGRAAEAAALSGLAGAVWRRLGTSLDAFGPHASAEGRDYADRIDRELGAERAAALRDEQSAVDLPDAVRLCIDIITSDEGTTPIAAGASGPAALTSREREVAELVVHGMSNKEIAARLVISRRTVDGHIERLLRKLDFTSRTQIAGWLSRHTASS